jgi:hypothetical protein
MDAAILRDLEPFRQARPVWDPAAEMILIAGTTRNADMRAADDRRNLARASQGDGLYSFLEEI